MKRRTFRILNFLALNLLFLALYLNFIHKDKDVQNAIKASQTVAVSGTYEPQSQHSSITVQENSPKENPPVATTN